MYAFIRSLSRPRLDPTDLAAPPQKSIRLRILMDCHDEEHLLRLSFIAAAVLSSTKPPRAGALSPAGLYDNN